MAKPNKNYSSIFNLTGVSVSNINESNEKAQLVASLGLCHIERDDKGKCIGGIAPAQGGEMAQIKLFRHPTGFQVMSCRHHQLGGGSHTCEAYSNRLVCYHVKAILIQSADEIAYDVSFSNDPSDNVIPIFVHPGRISYMKYIERPKPLKEENPQDNLETGHGFRSEPEQLPPPDAAPPQPAPIAPEEPKPQNPAKPKTVKKSNRVRRPARG